MGVSDMQFGGQVPGGQEQVVNMDDLSFDQPPPSQDPFPKAILSASEETYEELKAWLDRWIISLESSHQQKLDEWADIELQYRARSDGPQQIPFVGATGDVVPVMAMAVDPVHARLDTGVFQSNPVFVFRPLRKSVVDYVDAVESWVEYYQKHKLHLREVVSPRILEMTKYGTMVLKTIYDHEVYPIKTYDKSWNVITKNVTKFKGPKVVGIPLADFLFPPEYQHVQDCPIIMERQRYWPTDLMVAQTSGKLANVERIIGQKLVQRDTLEVEQQQASNHVETLNEVQDMTEVYEIWCKYDFNKDNLPERLVITYEKHTRTFLQLRYNWYFHQRYPYTVIPYSIANESLYGVGIGEMSTFFQDAETKWHRIATDNAYLANIRMFVAKKESGIEETPKLYCGRVFFVDNPKEDFLPFQAAEIYSSTLSERQNLFGLAEKRTGISDYLTGRESPIVGSRATATATTALIQEGTRRVEEVLENLRRGLAEVIENCMYLWIQYGLDGIDDIVFGNDEIGNKVKSFFDTINEENIHGALTIDLQTSDAASNKSIQQQVQLSLIQVMMQYLNKLVEAGQLAIQSAQQMPALTGLIGAVMESARKMFLDLLHKYDIKNAEQYLPDLETYLNGAVQGSIQGTTTGSPGQPAGPPGQPGIPSVSGSVFPPPSTIQPSIGVPGLGNGAVQGPGGMQGVPQGLFNRG